VPTSDHDPVRRRRRRAARARVYTACDTDIIL